METTTTLSGVVTPSLSFTAEPSTIEELELKEGETAWEVNISFGNTRIANYFDTNSATENEALREAQKTVARAFENIIAQQL